jgi:hypothetical protein
MLGKLELPAKNGRRYLIFGGPYRERATGMVGVKLAEEINAPAEVDIPIRDFSIPKAEPLIAGMSKTMTYMLQGKPIYVGCMGGKGRTGLFMAAFAKLWGIKDPVKFVRKTYYNHAVETAEQEKFIAKLEFPLSLKAKVIMLKWRGLVSRRICINPPDFIRNVS